MRLHGTYCCLSVKKTCNDPKKISIESISVLKDTIKKVDRYVIKVSSQLIVATRSVAVGCQLLIIDSVHMPRSLVVGFKPQLRGLGELPLCCGCLSSCEATILERCARTVGDASFGG